MTVLRALVRFSGHWGYWLAIVAIGMAMEGVALYYQYALNYGPCILCVQVRAWVLGIVLVALAAVWVRRRRVLSAIAHALMLGLAVGLMATSWETLAIERGWIEAACELQAEFPAWVPLHEWFPTAFEAWELCGYTPELPFGVTMAEALVVVAAAAVLFLVLQLLSMLRAPRP